MLHERLFVCQARRIVASTNHARIHGRASGSLHLVWCQSKHSTRSARLRAFLRLSFSPHSQSVARAETTIRSARKGFVKHDTVALLDAVTGRSLKSIHQICRAHRGIKMLSARLAQREILSTASCERCMYDVCSTTLSFAHSSSC